MPVEKKHAHFARIENSADAFLALLKGCEWTAGEAMSTTVIPGVLKTVFKWGCGWRNTISDGVRSFLGDPAGTKSASWRDFYPRGGQDR